MFPRRWSEDASIREVVEAMLADDADALAVAEEAGRRMGSGLALLIDALNPQIIVLGSLAVALGERILHAAREVVAEEHCRRRWPRAKSFHRLLAHISAMWRL